MDLVWTKITVAILFGLLRLIFGLLPIKLYSYLKIWQKGEDGIGHVNRARQDQVKRCLNLVQSFGGGVLFATCFLHMMPEVYHAVRELEKHYNTIKKYPFSQLMICIGFFLIYFIEEFSQYMITCVSTQNVQVFQKSDTPPSITNNSSALNKVTPTTEKNFQNIENDKSDKIVEKKWVEEDDKRSIQESVDSGLDKSNEDIIIPMPTAESELIMELEKSPQRILRSCLITMALSFHAVFEGIAIGLQNSVANIWYLFVAISIHSITLLFCVGVELLFSHKRPLMIFCNIAILAVTSPIGIFIGLAVTANTEDGNMGTAIASALLEGLSAGTLLYITFFEVLTREKEQTDFRFKRGACIIIGFIIMALLQALE